MCLQYLLTRSALSSVGGFSYPCIYREEHLTASFSKRSNSESNSLGPSIGLLVMALLSVVLLEAIWFLQAVFVLFHSASSTLS